MSEHYLSPKLRFLRYSKQTISKENADDSRVE